MVDVAAFLNYKDSYQRRKSPFRTRTVSQIYSCFRALCNNKGKRSPMANENTLETLDEFPMPIERNGKYVIPWENTGRPSLYEGIKTFCWDKNNSRIPSEKELDTVPEMKILKPVKHILDNTPTNGVQVTWLGHASTLVQFDGISILTDPVFSEYCGMYQMKPFGTKRYRKCPVDVGDLPIIHAIVISHDHYDHLDHNTVKKLNARFGNKLRWYVPLGLQSWMNATGCTNVVEMTWWQEDDFPIHLSDGSVDGASSSSPTSNTSVKFVFTPAQHWCTRNGLDENTRLFGSWVVIGPRHRFYFAGDTGYCNIFKSIGKKYGPFDLAAIPIGSYCPRDFMKFQHINVDDAVKVHGDIKARKSLGIHWGTFNLSFEYYLEPLQLLKETLENADIPAEDFFCLRHGETVTV